MAGIFRVRHHFDFKLLGDSCNDLRSAAEINYQQVVSHTGRSDPAETLLRYFQQQSRERCTGRLAAANRNSHAGRMQALLSVRTARSWLVTRIGALRNGAGRSIR